MSRQDLIRTQSVLSLFHRPLDDPDIDGWRQLLNQELRALLGADTAIFVAPFAGLAPSVHSGIDSVAIQGYFDHFASQDPGPENRLRQKLDVCSQRMIYPDDLRETELFNDFFQPNNLAGGLLMHADLPDDSVAFVSVGRNRSDAAYEERGLGILQLLLPGFQAAAHTIWRRHPSTSGLATFIDRLRDGAAVFGPLGKRLLHANPALLRVLGEDSEADRLQAEIESAAREAARLANGHVELGAEGARHLGPRQIRTTGGEYQIVANHLTTLPTKYHRVILITLIPRGLILPSQDELRERFNLTRREAQVAELLARGASDRQVAERLIISWHTARGHAERVLQKLGVASRAEVAARLLGG